MLFEFVQFPHIHKIDIPPLGTHYTEIDGRMIFGTAAALSPLPCLNPGTRPASGSCRNPPQPSRIASHSGRLVFLTGSPHGSPGPKWIEDPDAGKPLAGEKARDRRQRGQHGGAHTSKTCAPH